MSTAERSTPRPEPRSPGADETRRVPDDVVWALTVTDPALFRRLKAEREASGLHRRDEMWNGVYVMSPLANLEHQWFASQFWLVFHSVVDSAGLGISYNGLNVSDREEGWLSNYREPDLGVYLIGNPSKNCGTHMCGGPDFAVEILSPNDPARHKRDFYEGIGTRELLIFDREPWAFELYRLIQGKLELVGTSTPEKSDILTSQVMPLAFRLEPGEGRPTIVISRVDGGQTWRI
jgi:Uma2 family endonuclease